MHRRRFLGLGSVALLPTLAGCGGDDFDPIESKKQLGEAPGLSIKVEPDREYEYLEERDEIRFGWSGETMPMGEWGTERAADEAADAVDDHLREHGIQDDHVSSDVNEVDRFDIEAAGGDPDDAEFERDRPLGVTVQHTYTYDRDGALHSKPEIPFEDVVAGTTRSVAVTLALPDHEYRAVLPVMCWRTVVRFE